MFKINESIYNISTFWSFFISAFWSFFHNFASMYSDSISALYFSLITFLFSFKVGVNSPPYIENSTGNIANFDIFCALDIAFLFAISIPSFIILRRPWHYNAYLTVFAFEPLELM